MITKVKSTNNIQNFSGIKLGNKAQKALAKVSDFSSIQQRIAIGSSALIFQPIIDFNNKNVDKETRKVSALRSASKAVIGTLTGLLVRGVCMKAVEHSFAKKDSAQKIIRESGKIVLDEAKIYNTFKKGFESLGNVDPSELSKALKRVPSIIGTIIALGIMIITNFVLDAPLTNKTLELLEKTLEKHAKNKETGGSTNG